MGEVHGQTETEGLAQHQSAPGIERAAIGNPHLHGVVFTFDVQEQGAAAKPQPRQPGAGLAKKRQKRRRARCARRRGLGLDHRRVRPEGRRQLATDMGVLPGEQPPGGGVTVGA